jgi:hypothetical protein
MSMAEVFAHCAAVRIAIRVQKKLREKSLNTCHEKKSSYNLASAGALSSECSK